MKELLKTEFKVFQGGNRHEALLRVTEHYLLDKKGRKDEEQALKRARRWNRLHSLPPLSEGDKNDIPAVFESAKKFVSCIIEQEEKKRDQEEAKKIAEEADSVPIELTPDLTPEMTLQELDTILSTSIKRDSAPKKITFLGMLLSQTENSQINIVIKEKVQQENHGLR